VTIAAHCGLILIKAVRFLMANDRLEFFEFRVVKRVISAEKKIKGKTAS
jgi:hypothetical protein